MNKLGQVSGIMRVIDPRYPSNLLAVGLAVIGGVATLWQSWSEDQSLLESLLRAVIAGVVVFMGWAIARELDPDHAGSAGLAGLFTLIGVQFIEPQLEMLALIAILLSLRAIAATTGVPLKPLDYLAIGFWWIIGIGLLISSRLEPDLELTPVFAAGLVGIILLNLFAEYGLPHQLTSVGDFSDKPLERRRIRAAIYVASALIALLLILNRPDVIVPLIAVSYALVLYTAYLRGRG